MSSEFHWLNIELGREAGGHLVRRHSDISSSPLGIYSLVSGRISAYTVFSFSTATVAAENKIIFEKSWREHD